MKVSVIVPTYNERENIEKMIKGIFNEFKSMKIKGEVIVVDDNSPDKTSEVVKSKIKKYPHLRLILRKKREGLGVALRNGYDEAKEDIIMSIDSDFFDFSVIPTMYKMINKQNCDFCVGSRYGKKGKIIGKRKFRILQSKIAAALASIVLGIKVDDPNLNIRGMKKDAWKNIKTTTNKNVFLTECVYKFYKKGFKVCQFPITYEERREGSSKMNVISESFHFLINIFKLRFSR